MIDIKRLLEESDLVAQNNKNRGKEIDVHVAIRLHDQRIARLEEIQSLRTRGNEIAAKIPSVTSQDERKALIEEGKIVKETVKQQEAELGGIESDLETVQNPEPDILLTDRPVGNDETGNVLLRIYLEPTSLSFPLKDHLDLGADLDLIDMDRAAKVSGARFAYLKGDAVLLEFALIQ